MSSKFLVERQTKAMRVEKAQENLENVIRFEMCRFNLLRSSAELRSFCGNLAWRKWAAKESTVLATHSRNV